MYLILTNLLTYILSYIHHYLLTCFLTYILTYLFTYLLTSFLIYLLTYFLTSVLTYLLIYLLMYIFTNSIQHSPPWEANRFAASQEIPHISWNPKIYFRIHKRPPPVSILSQLNPVHNSTSNFLNIDLNITLLPTPGSPKWSLLIPICLIRRERDRWGDPGVDGRIMLGWIFKK
jgi:predicted PurR-regulated permease PerM